MTTKGAQCSRREALALVAMSSGAALFARPALAFSNRHGQLPNGTSVIAYFNDGLLADPTGIMLAYRRPRAFRGARRAGQLSEAERINAGFAL